ncbi:MAG: acyltransferase domain-containing protein [Proteobacteria bacterium]|nr:acyltransferase domain-containing protein [Pseudomonadota bacterium]MBU1710093.1 acyltransferase domain-containing protein [Pseudomonadota bacterium]
MIEPQDIAIIGAAGVYPKAGNFRQFWRNILNKVDAITDAPEEWLREDLYDPNSSEFHHVYTIRGGFINDYTDFDPTEFGVLPNSLEGTDPEQFLPLNVAKAALIDAGYFERDFNRARTGVILGRQTLFHRANCTYLQQAHGVGQTIKVIKALLPETPDSLLNTLEQKLRASIPKVTPDNCSIAAPSLITGRIANRLDLQGPNYGIDAACASSLIAMDQAILELQRNRCDMVISGGLQASSPYAVFIVFCQLSALTRKASLRPFGVGADGTLLGEGMGMVVLKRLSDAERDHDHIYAVIKSVGSSSDGKGLGVLVPRFEGQLLSLERAYESPDLDPQTVGLIEAHGTGTPVGDETEIRTLKHFFGERKGEMPHMALGSVKSMIGHSMAAAGAASVIKSMMALYHKVLPPTLCDEPDAKFEFPKSTMYVNTQVRPWIHGLETPRRAGINAFGFGGINAHLVLEEYLGNSNNDKQIPIPLEWPSELVCLKASSRDQLLKDIERLLVYLIENNDKSLADISYTMNCDQSGTGDKILSVIAPTIDGLLDKLTSAKEQLEQSDKTIYDPRGIFYFADPLGKKGKIAILFPGQGASYVNMLSELCMHFPPVREYFDKADRIYVKHGFSTPLSRVLYPPPAHSIEDKEAPGRLMFLRHYNNSALWSANSAYYYLTTKLGITAELFAGHSTGDFNALIAAGAIPPEAENFIVDLELDFNDHVKAYAEKLPKVKTLTVGGILPEEIIKVAKESKGEVQVALDNCPNQIFLCGSASGIVRAQEKLVSKGAICLPVAINQPFHTSWYEPLFKPLREKFSDIPTQKAHAKIYSSALASDYPADPEEIRDLFLKQWMMPVRFRETIEKMYADGARVFLEVGPNSNLCGFVRDTLGKAEHIAVPLNMQGKSDLNQLNLALGTLAAHGIDLDLAYLYEGREAKALPIFREIQTGQDTALPKKSRAVKLNQGLPVLNLDEETVQLFRRTIRASSSGVGDELPSGKKEDAMSSFMQTMDQFLSQQHEVMTRYLAKKKSKP